MSRTRRIYNKAKQWFKIRITKWGNGYEDGVFGMRNDGYHPYHQYDTFHCHCSWCQPKENEIGSIRNKRKQYILTELINS